MGNLDRAIELGREYIASQEEAKEQERLASLSDEDRQREEEAKKAADEQSQKEAEELKKREEEIEELLEKDDADLDEEKLKLKQQALEDEENLDGIEKLKKAQKRALKRIDKLTRRIGETSEDFEKREQTYVERIRELEARLDKKIEEVKPKPDVKEIQKQKIAQYVQEDVNKPREQRREMTRDELEEWISEDGVAATEWIVERNRRREKEIESLQSADVNKKYADEFVKKQEESVKRLSQKFPNSRPESEARALKAEGKTNEEIMGVLSEKYPEFKIANEVLQEKPEMLQKENFGDLMAEEIAKRLPALAKTPEKKPESKPETRVFTEEEVEAMVKEKLDAERKRLEQVDVGDSSSQTGQMSVKKGDKLSVDEQKLVDEVNKINKRGAHLDVEKVLQRNRERKGMPNLKSYATLKDEK